MKKINLYTILGVLSICIFFASCSDMDEINTNPDAPTKMTPGMICTNVMLQLAKHNGDSKAFIATNALPKYVAYANEGGAMQEQYNSLGNASFNNYTILPNLDKMVEFSEGQATASSYKGVAHFARAYMLYDLSMRMGDVPFSEANQGDKGDFTPKYDTQESIFTTILEELEAAEKAFVDAGTRKFDGDPIYGGDATLWAKATNSFTLKVLLSLSKKVDIASLKVKERFSNIVAAGNLLQKNADNFGLTYANEIGKYHPLYQGEKFTTNTVVSDIVVDNLKRLKDRRLFYYAEPSPVKIGSGKLESDMDAYLGVDVSAEYATLNTIFNSKDISLLNNRYAALRAAESLALISYAEQSLIIAEAIELGWISGDSKTYYEEGVKAALSQVGATDASFAHTMPIDDAYISTYFTGEAAYKASKNERLEQIWMQKYLLHFMQDATSSYFEYRRTGYPVFPINTASSLNEYSPESIPMRWLYPTVETTTNKDNLVDALERQFGSAHDEINNIMWILK